MISPGSADDNLTFYSNCHCTLKCCTFSKNKIKERMVGIGELKTGLVFLDWKWLANFQPSKTKYSKEHAQCFFFINSSHLDESKCMARVRSWIAKIYAGLFEGN